MKGGTIGLTLPWRDVALGGLVVSGDQCEDCRLKKNKKYTRVAIDQSIISGVTNRLRISHAHGCSVQKYCLPPCLLYAMSLVLLRRCLEYY